LGAHRWLSPLSGLVSHKGRYDTSI
jgi:hypothetical protein